MRAAILAVGSELLGPERLDTNSLHLTRLLRRYGVEVGRKAVVGDDREEIALEVGAALDRFPILLVSGGLGPTADDVTREGVAAALGRRLERRAELERELERRFASFGYRMPEANRRQADLVAGAEVIPNPHGTAPGQRVEDERGVVFLLPGVPRELEAMAEEAISPWLAARSTTRVDTRVLKVACTAESAVEEMLAPYYERFGSRDVTILASAGDITLAVTRGGEHDRRDAELEERVQLLRSLVGDAVYGDRPADTLEGVVGEMLSAAGATLATAESCTGGMLAERITRQPGSSGWFVGGAVTYSNRLKTSLLGVETSALERFGAVSEEVVRAMATGARRRFAAGWAVAISGIAGPGGGSEEKPVGTVHLAVAGPGDDDVRHRRLQLPGDRQRVRILACQWALDTLRRGLAEAAR
ncbi:MAG: competence/damage-inducible protein A [Thermoanaerobaculia bacterium]|nr:competence/damage-inducible protein A [Thermoanaerobaculia bacterium]